MMAEPDTSEDIGLRSLKSAQRFLGLSRAKIYRLAQAGDIDFVKVGAATRVTQESLDRYMATLKTQKRMTPKGKL